MKVAVIASTLSLCAFLVHLIAWRLHVPRRQTAALLVTFTLTLVLGLTFFSSAYLRTHGWALDQTWECIHVGIFHLAMMLGYVVAYSAIEEKSPSMSIVTWVAEAGEKGRTREEVEKLLSDNSPIESRLQAMLRDRMVKRRHHEYVLTDKGRLWAVVFAIWGRLMNAGRGG